jgi:hypothetical protein
MPARKQITKTTTPTISEPRRKGFAWSTNEINRLHNEYELKELTVYEIAELHSRGVSAILHRLADEGLISASWKDARGFSFDDAKPSVKSSAKTATKKTIKKKALSKPALIIDELHDYTGSSDTEDESYSDSDEEYTLEDAQNDYDTYSYRSKAAFFEDI